MKWFKHMTNDLDDSFIQDLIYKYGGDGYLVYFGTISLICKVQKKKITCEANFPSHILKRKFQISVRRIREILNFCSDKTQLSYTFSGEDFDFYYPKILEIKDEYSRKSCQAPDNVPPRVKNKDIKKKEIKNEEVVRNPHNLDVERFMRFAQKTHKFALKISLKETKDDYQKLLGLLKSILLTDLQLYWWAYLQRNDSYLEDKPRNIPVFCGQMGQGNLDQGYQHFKAISRSRRTNREREEAQRRHWEGKEAVYELERAEGITNAHN